MSVPSGCAKCHITEKVEKLYFAPSGEFYLFGQPQTHHWLDDKINSGIRLIIFHNTISKIA